MIWPHVTKKHPCPICGKSDWCSIGERAILCQREQSSKPHPKGGWYHPIGGEIKRSLPAFKPKPSPPLLTGIASMIERWALQTPIDAFETVSESLGVSPDSLASLNMVYAAEHRAWAFPMCDGYGEMIGVRLRSDDGRKWAVRGSRGGIFMPHLRVLEGESSKSLANSIFLVEGPTSTAAALTLGLSAIGRPSCNSGGDFVLDALRRLKVSRVVIVADNDDKCTGLRPGFDGAQKLAKELKGIRSIIWTPPTKDIRDFLRAGGTRKLIESDVKNLIWQLG